MMSDVPMATDNVKTIYLYTLGQRRGPYEKAEIQAMWHGGQITKDALYWHEGMPQWAAISGLFADTTMPPPLPEMPPTPKPERATYDATTNTFRGTMPQVAKLAMRAIQALGWKLDNVNETLGLVTFETGMTWGSWSGGSGSL